MKLPQGVIERLLGGSVALCMGLALLLAVLGLATFTPTDVTERVFKIVAGEFAAMLCLYCFLIVVWCVCTPRWVQAIVDKVMRYFRPLALVLGAGTVLVLGLSLALAS